MSVGDFRVRADFFRHLKTRALARVLGDAGVLALLRLWAWAAEPENRRTTGDLSGMGDMDIELAAEWGGEPGRWAAELARLRWIDGPEGARALHDWSEHQPWVTGAPARAIAAREAAARRWSRASPTLESQEKMRAACAPHAGGNAAAMLPTARLPDYLGKEGGGEDSSTSSAGTSRPAPRLRRSTPRVRSAGDVDSPVALRFSCTGPTPWWELTEAQVARWRELYPSVDVLAECRKALAWTETGRRKTAAGMPRFLASWLGRASDRPRRPSAAPAPARDYRREAELAREAELREVYRERGILPAGDSPTLRALPGGGS